MRFHDEISAGTQDSSHYPGNNFIFSRESQPKPSFATLSDRFQNIQMYFSFGPPIFRLGMHGFCRVFGGIQVGDLG